MPFGHTAVFIPVQQYTYSSDGPSFELKGQASAFTSAKPLQVLKQVQSSYDVPWWCTRELGEVPVRVSFCVFGATNDQFHVDWSTHLES